ncbi:hypothetical protein CDAR_253121 [Caerostris darwini]|uniref:Uncharacterized protein n=1 Tax=Caerostris darwini TaxID=1538125 RepID=A0AAV4RAB3_9ARAC|nr:hypothetical protein CDAR_253121 [Caerostris darwini]
MKEIKLVHHPYRTREREERSLRECSQSSAAKSSLAENIQIHPHSHIRELPAIKVDTETISKFFMKEIKLVHYPYRTREREERSLRECSQSSAAKSSLAENIQIHPHQQLPSRELPAIKVDTQTSSEGTILTE